MACFGSSTFQVLNGPRVGSLLFHVSVSYWHTFHVAVSPRVYSSLDHVLSFICPRGRFLFDHMSSTHVSFLNSAMWLDHFHPRVGLLEAHVSCPRYFTCNALVRPCDELLFDHVGSPGSSTCNALVRPHVELLFDHVGCPGSSMGKTFISSQK
jgi:hypothetical protein